ncbi:PREDICTED: V-type proton ATPase subunit G 1-like [Odobenus rosmarus divergens]|uniref:V-type proton ATPase subunit G n=1 Tax=Odobenus rosmarus divergens TaxID=9708 RepID=A0A9B0HFT9_ODORO
MVCRSLRKTFPDCQTGKRLGEDLDLKGPEKNLQLQVFCSNGEAVALGSHGSCSTEVEKETQEKMTILQACFQQNKDEVLDNLLAFVCDIRPEIHDNYRING